MALYSGYFGRVTLVGSNGTTYNLYGSKFVLSAKSVEEDVTTAQTNIGNVGRAFVASQIPRIDVSVDGFWTSLNNPFGNPIPLQIGYTYGFKLFFDKNNLIPNVNTQLLILGCEISSSVRDVIRYVVTGVIQGSLYSRDSSWTPGTTPIFLPLQ